MKVKDKKSLVKSSEHKIVQLDGIENHEFLVKYHDGSEARIVAFGNQKGIVVYPDSVGEDKIKVFTFGT